MKLSFLGANRQVTGSRYGLHVDGNRIQIDCGLFQEREFAAQNWERSPVAANQIEALLLTHAHIDHSGLIPRFVRDGFQNEIFATRPTVELAKIMLRDSAHIHMEDAKYKRKRHRKEGRNPMFPDEPLYDIDDAERAIRQFRAVDYATPFELNKSMVATFHDAGHILGSSIIEIQAREDGQQRSIVFSGDIGQWDRPLIGDPTLLPRADYVVMESTYGDRDHDEHGDVESELARIINETSARGGKVIIPTFAVERAQELMFYISRLVHNDRIPDIPVYLDSPMAIDVTNLFGQFEHLLDDESRALIHSNEPPMQFPGLHMTRSTDESRAINSVLSPCIIMSASGMCTAGRIKHHLRQNIERHENTVLFVGYQGSGTLGRQILEGAAEVRIHGRQYRVGAHIEKINGFSAHADRSELLKWISAFDPPPRHVFLTHGEESVSQRFAETLRTQLQLDVSVPHYDSTIDLE